MLTISIPSLDSLNQLGYGIVVRISAIIGLVFTSVLIGIVSSMIESRIITLRKGNSIVKERNNIVILGYNIGEHDLLNQLIFCNRKEHKCIVICSDIEKDELEDEINREVNIPANISVVCRHGDITKPNDLVCCSIENRIFI